jgi:transcriptional regulator with XRE-family HTH domain
MRSRSFAFSSADPANLGKLAGTKARSKGLRQQDIAKALGINQSQVSRILTGRIRRHTSVVERVCQYVLHRELDQTRRQVRDNAELIDALAAAWDGTSQHASALATVIRGLGALRR